MYMPTICFEQYPYAVKYPFQNSLPLPCAAQHAHHRAMQMGNLFLLQTWPISFLITTHARPRTQITIGERICSGETKVFVPSVYCMNGICFDKNQFQNCKKLFVFYGEKHTSLSLTLACHPDYS